MPLQMILERALGRCVARALHRARPLIIGVAGSVGKSSTKTAIGVALGALEKGSGVAMSLKNYNNELGVPLTVLGSDAPHRSLIRWGWIFVKAVGSALGLPLRARTFVLEMGTDKPGDLKYLTSIALPSIGVLTAIGIEHTEFFGSVEGVAQEEGTIVSVLAEHDIAVVNADDRRAMEALNGLRVRCLSFGTAESATARILKSSIVLNASAPERSGLEVQISLYGTRRYFLLRGTVGRSQAYASAAALACVAALDQDVDTAISRLENGFHGMPGRMQLIEGIKHTWLIDDSYNASPLASFSALQDLANFPVEEGARRIAALGDMLELGSLAEEAHVDMGRAAAEAGIDMLITCGTLAHIAADAAQKAGMSPDRIFTFAQSEEAGRFIQGRLKQHDVVLIKGSQGMRMERITRELMAHPEKAETLLVRQTPDWLAKV